MRAIPNTKRRSVLVEIGDEAYKQNTVYRPWHDIIEGNTNAASETPVRKSKVRTLTG